MAPTGVLGEGRVRGLVQAVLMLALGGTILTISWADLREALRRGPVERDCAGWLEAPSEARWVALSGCRLDLALAARRNLKGFLPQSDGGRAPTRTLELFLPVSASEEREVPIRAVVATSDPALLSTVDELAALPVEAVDAFVDAHRELLESRLKPARLQGYVEPLAAWSARKALQSLEAPGAVVLVQDREPERANALFSLGVALALIVWPLWGPLSRLARRGRPAEP
jgi:hypothetical protein